ncbi:NtaA/DmoA family FMN-dependent monooxygenase [Gordonia sp. ABSL1-1]|uniref:NtaA/DmoA family FMN-dependent monooxygenase n=1 Tax=Gordonia sp. ABSL1-1 TaxID=3053923 RepID=UPI002572933D|nr:NtaA/DmoA family FMN-dependent monooxygenase [Gordonia sp. ABSL1-1]MDL9937801.1 NtaA/DmoA family FMN-dependent monooxygenase [Gordonia sp. ABSL1-1]
MTERRLLHLNVNGNGLAKPPNSWRRSDPPLWFLDFASWEKLGVIAERALLDAVFLADSLPSQNFDVPWHAFDPFQLQIAIARATRHIGLVATLSATFYQPWDVARRAATLDVASGGRAAINVVTSGSDDAAALYGKDPLPGRDFRYGRADEVLTAVKQLWGSWGEATVVGDPVTGRLVSGPDIPHVDFDGEHLGFRGRFQFPPSPQGRPVIFQAGGSPQGIELAAKHADAVFCQANTVATGRDFYRSLKARVAAHGRSPDDVLVLPGLNITLGSTEAEARRRRAELVTIDVDQTDQLADFAATLGVPVDLLDPDRTPPWDYIDGTEWKPRTIGGANAILSVARRENLTIRQLISRGAGAQRATVGTPEQVADSIEQWFTEGAADGFNINFDVFPTGLEQIADHLIPELQRRGLFRTSYEHDTFRGNLGLSPKEHLR